MTDGKTDLGRRGLLLGLGAAGLGGALASPALAATEQSVTQAPLAQPSTEAISPYGLHQAGIVTPRPAHGLFASFAVLVRDKDEFEKLMRRLGERIEVLTKGGPVPELDPKLPPFDSGLLGPVISPDALTITLSLGASFFDSRDWLAAHKPAKLQRMTSFPNDALVAEDCHGDLGVQICANSSDSVIHALRDLIKNIPDQMVLKWKVEGSVPVLPAAADGKAENARNFLGFRDGSANPDPADHAMMDRMLWVSAPDEPAWAKNGSYQAVRVIRNFVERWDRTALGEQERIFGRMKMNGAPMDNPHGSESDVPDYAKDPEGKVTRLTAHIRLANDRTAAHQENLILRRPFNYSLGVTKSGQLDQGLLFIAYQADLEAGFITVQNRLNGEPLEEYIKPVGGGYFFALPGFEAGSFPASQLIASL
ncbi:iron uptake transporter deferrochelatase/peroxidase subunit [Paracoccus aminophilus]|uniref:Deferrochelatase n=1 Tax=Paracoccus aminophilus JCM 7686 TaxID=1367847 RepID=S5XSK7_PARAH|nr:iron uptake transporter deferrochelatase/peroxidase subunit [Paracoccus aminophilus]AGT08092.1 iron-dependent peroxidase [Paracoccus aminophilus JCM 7686]